MTFNEFKAWLEGYEVSFAMKRSPNAEEWEKIKEKLATVIPVMNYVPPFPTIYYNNPPNTYTIT